jgi:hypothetical protein
VHAEGWVAVGTLLLAAATFVLAWHTRRLALSSAADLRAQWRPIVLPYSPGQQAARDVFEHDELDGTLKVGVRNAGRGPALYLRTELDPEIGANAVHGPIAALADGDEQLFTFNGVNKDIKNEPFVQVLVDYRDLAGRTYSTSITLDLWNRTFYDVQLFEGASTHHGDAVYPQPGLRDASPKGPQPITLRMRNAGRALAGKTTAGGAS